MFYNFILINNDLSQQELDHKFKDGERGERYKIHIHRIVVVSMYAIGVVMLFLIIIRDKNKIFF